jgi:hypothetical protein
VLRKDPPRSPCFRLAVFAGYGGGARFGGSYGKLGGPVQKAKRGPERLIVGETTKATRVTTKYTRQSSSGDGPVVYIPIGFYGLCTDVANGGAVRQGFYFLAKTQRHKQSEEVMSARGEFESPRVFFTQGRKGKKEKK